MAAQESLSEEQVFDFAKRLEPAQQLSFWDLYKSLSSSTGPGIAAKIDAKAAAEKAALEKLEAEKASVASGAGAAVAAMGKPEA